MSVLLVVASLIIAAFLIIVVLVCLSEKRSDKFWEAVSNGHVDSVQKLLEAGADVNKITEGNPYIPSGNTVLDLAVVRGHTEVVKVLLEAGANHINDLRSDLNGAVSMRSTEVVTELVKVLLEAGADVNRGSLNRDLYYYML